MTPLISAICILLLATLSSVILFVESRFQVQCYLPSWSLSNDALNSFKVSDLDPFGPCNVFVYAFFKVVDNKLAAEDGKFRGHFAQLSTLKSQNPDIRLYLSVGGWNSSHELTNMAASSLNRSIFVSSVVPNLRRWNMDGLDLDWEFPKDEEKHNYIALLKDLRLAFEAESTQSNLERLVLTVAVGNTVQAGYLPKEMHSFVDVVNVMTYDYHGTWEQQTGHNAAMPDTTKSIIDWEAAGIPRTNLSLGIPFYARTWTTASDLKENSTTGQTAIGSGLPGFLTHQNGTLSYAEICSNLKSGWTSTRDARGLVPFAHLGDQWASYDDVESVAAKVIWAQSQGLQGIFIWHLGVDDVQGYCGKKFSLLSAVSQSIIKTNLIPTVTPSKPTSGADQLTTTAGQPRTHSVVVTTVRRVTISTTCRAPTVAVLGPISDSERSLISWPMIFLSFFLWRFFSTSLM